MSLEKLEATLNSIDWGKNVGDFLNDKNTAKRYADCNIRLAIWSKQIETGDAGNIALPFIREMQASGQNVTALGALAVYRAAAAAARTAVECSLYYTFFRVHPTELATLFRDKTYYIDKNEVLAFLKKHSPDFMVRQESLSFITYLNPWYSDVSAIVHGQKPGVWSSKTPLKDLKSESAITAELLNVFERGVMLIDALFKICLAPDIWHVIPKSTKQTLVKGMSGPQKVLLGLDSG